VISLSAIRSKMSTRGRLLLSVFVIAWMNATLQPCLMAMELPPTEAAQISEVAEPDSHHNHVATQVDQDGPACPHCPPSMSHDSDACAATAVSDCDILPKAKPGERILKADFSDAFGAAHSNYHFSSLDIIPTKLLVVSLDCTKPKYVVGPSISIRNCVFLK
jgi:hypothetical protein